jgi:phosphatidylglycerol:prolipoprotein diacylglycerol transferase
MNPVAFRIGGLPVYWYGILIVAGVLAGAGVSTWQARRRQQDTEHVWNALLVCLILGIIGARVYHVFSTSQGGAIGWPYYREHPIDALRIWHGGLGLIGAIIGGALGMALYARLAKISAFVWLDIGTYGLLLATAIGRWGNYINQELYGPPTTLPWGIRIAPPYRIMPFHDLTAYPPDTLFHPVFLYESLWCLLGFALIWWVFHRYRDALLDGDVFWLYLIWYPLGRFLVEYLRPDAWMLGPIAAAQVFSAVSVVAATLLLIFRHRRRKVAGDPETESQAVH